MLVKRAEMVEIECVARGYISGSGWKEYRQSGTVCGIRLPAGLEGKRQAARADLHAGHQGADRPRREHLLRADGLASRRTDLATRLRDLTLDIYTRAARYAETRGIIIADTKFEFGFVDGELVLGDEVLTPDSSRFWPADTIGPAARSSPSTSSSCAITWNRFTGTSSRPRRRCRRKWPRAPARNTARRTSALTGREL